MDKMLPRLFYILTVRDEGQRSRNRNSIYCLTQAMNYRFGQSVLAFDSIARCESHFPLNENKNEQTNERRKPFETTKLEMNEKKKNGMAIECEAKILISSHTNKYKSEQNVRLLFN